VVIAQVVFLLSGKDYVLSQKEAGLLQASQK